MDYCIFGLPNLLACPAYLQILGIPPNLSAFTKVSFVILLQCNNIHSRGYGYKRDNDQKLLNLIKTYGGFPVAIWFDKNFYHKRSVS